MAEADIIPVFHSKKSRMCAVARRVPWYTLSMFAVYMSIYFTICQNPKGDGRNDGLELDTYKADEVYRWYTYSLLHLNGMHIGTNMLTLGVYGTLIEFDNGPWRVFLIHILSILGGAFGVGWESRFKQRERMYVIGASGGNYGLLSSQVGNLVLNWPELTLIRRILYGGVLVSCVLSDVVVNIVLYNPDISYSAHVGGFVFGLFAGLSVMKNIRVLAWERRMKIVMGGIFGVLCLMSAINLGMLGQ